MIVKTWSLSQSVYYTINVGLLEKEKFASRKRFHAMRVVIWESVFKPQWDMYCPCVYMSHGTCCSSMSQQKVKHESQVHPVSDSVTTSHPTLRSHISAWRPTNILLFQQWKTCVDRSLVVLPTLQHDSVFCDTCNTLMDFIGFGEKKISKRINNGT